jgi:hypothetical protein
MKLEFVREGSPDCPLLRFYDFDSAEARQLQHAVLRLVRKSDEMIALHEQPGIRTVAGCELTLLRADNVQGVRETAPGEFEWLYSIDGWLEVAGLIQPFCQGDAGGFQWLNRIGKIAVLLSRDGSW